MAVSVSGPSWWEVSLNEPPGFRDFVATRSPSLLRSAWLLTGDEALAQDLVQTSLAKMWSRWSRLERQGAAEAYARKVMLTSFLSWRRRRWHGERPVGVLPERADARDAFADADLRAVVAAALAELPRRQRAVVVLRYFDDVTEAQAAEVLGCAVGTVKSQTSKALEKLRGSPHLAGVFAEEQTHEHH